MRDANNLGMKCSRAANRRRRTARKPKPSSVKAAEAIQNQCRSSAREEEVTYDQAQICCEAGHATTGQTVSGCNWQDRGLGRAHLWGRNALRACPVYRPNQLCWVLQTAHVIMEAELGDWKTGDFNQLALRSERKRLTVTLGGIVASNRARFTALGNHESDSCGRTYDHAGHLSPSVCLPRYKRAGRAVCETRNAAASQTNSPTDQYGRGEFSPVNPPRSECTRTSMEVYP